MATIQEFITANKIAMWAEPADGNPNMDTDGHAMNHWLCHLTTGRRRLTIPFSQGLGIEHDPKTADVLDCLASDASSIENANGFESWASEFGYDTDSRKAERTYRLCQQQAAKLKKFLGANAYANLLWTTERE